MNYKKIAIISITSLLLASYAMLAYFGDVKTEYLRRHMVEKAIHEFNPGEKVLEIGSGKRWRYVEGSITLNRDLSAEADVIGDAQNLPFEENSFDSIYCLEVIEHTPEPQEIINEMHRTLKPGGQVLLTVPFMFEIHDTQDYRRFTRQGLEYLFRDYSNVSVRPNGGKFGVICHLIRSTYVGARTHKFWNNLGYYLDEKLEDKEADRRFTLGWTVIADK